ncbi:MAG TPA: RNB domain-containing ribonuclease [Acidimicrobiales bacterium]|nr:RNB domain-containing ribonuclease [Acidimicrobiales bacterium]
MPQPRRRVRPIEPVVGDGLAAIRHELGVPAAFPDEVLAAAATLGPAPEQGRVDRRDLPMCTIDPEGSTDLDQALAVEAVDGGHVVWYAIADVAAFVVPGDPIDVESRRRGVTLYSPDGRAPLHPPALSEDLASLLPDQDRPAVLWRLRLDPDGQLVEVTVGRATVRSRVQLSYEEAQQRIDAGDDELAPLAVVGEQRLAIERDRGGVSLPVPDQEAVRDGDGYRLAYRAQLPVERWNAQLSLLCGMAAADLMLAGGWGLLRTLPPADEESLAALRRHAAALGVPWPERARYADVIHDVDPSDPAAAAFLIQATRLFRGADHVPLRPGSAAPDDVLVHAAIAAPYAHVTAPLRRLGDRFATECVLATVHGKEPPAWARDALEELPELLRSSMARANELDRAVVDHLEALVLSSHVGERFRAVVVDQRKGAAVVQLREPAVVATVPGEHPLGEEVDVEVVSADPVARTVELAVRGSR